MRSSTELRYLIDGHRRGENLAAPFYLHEEIFAHEVSAVLGPQWLMVGHASLIPKPGDYFTVDALGAAVVIVRGGNDDINAFHNVCRHRGARLCEDASGHAALFRCRYHGWSYKLSGELAAWRHMPEGLDPAAYGLRRCGVTLFEGLILVSLLPEAAPDAAKLLAPVREYWERYDLSACKVAAERTYDITANWKLCIENNLECYHCLPNHPEYTAVNAFVRADERVPPAAVDEFAAYQRTWAADMGSHGVRTGRSELVEVAGQLCRAGTWPLAPGKCTASRDGSPLAPLLGRVGRYDESVTTGCIGFLSYVMATSDYALTVTYLPVDARRTRAVMRWLVRREAVAGRDYDVDALCYVWDETTKQDKQLIEINAAGVGAMGFVPGPYSLLETLAADFVERYLALMQASL
ncbi:MAG: aromatic ring-hydroxylating dioxygenase subunit alpha [Proteobacteria bacterium]|nr:aromatic ring-hydroxylating dioxygenase subunit alpha [Pseudomonadota bacterium]